jgi:hypothetical protein
LLHSAAHRTTCLGATSSYEGTDPALAALRRTNRKTVQATDQGLRWAVRSCPQDSSRREGRDQHVRTNYKVFAGQSKRPEPGNYVSPLYIPKFSTSRFIPCPLYASVVEYVCTGDD